MSFIRFVVAALTIHAVDAFAPSSLSNKGTRTAITTLDGGRDPNFDLSGNTWKPTEGRMQSTDTGDYAPTNQEDIDMMKEINYTDGMYGSQPGLDKSGRNKGPALPGLENLGEDAIMSQGITVAEGIPADMEFIPSSVPDGTIEWLLQASSGQPKMLEIKPFCMGYEDYYAAFTKDSDPVFLVKPATGRMDRRGGKATVLEIICLARGVPGEYQGTLVINLPDDGSKLTYIVKANAM